MHANRSVDAQHSPTLISNDLGHERVPVLVIEPQQASFQKLRRIARREQWEKKGGAVLVRVALSDEDSEVRNEGCLICD